MAKLNYLTQNQLDAFDETGYLVFEGFFDEEYNQRLKTDVDLLMKDRGSGVKEMVISYDSLGWTSAAL